MMAAVASALGRLNRLPRRGSTCDLGLVVESFQCG